MSAQGKTLCRLLPCVGPEVLREWARYLEHAGLAILDAVPIMRDRGKGQREFPILQTFMKICQDTPLGRAGRNGSP